MQIISTKQLRNDFENVRNLLEEGESILLIHRSQPLARIEPIEKRLQRKKLLNQLRKIAGGLELGHDLTPKRIRRILDKRYESLLSGC
jgi:antitoxin (DNA-binding transcriptional repressor) of toxin-antitoxin stability system